MNRNLCVRNFGRVSLACALAAPLFINSAQAQVASEPATESTVLNPVIVTATRMAAPVEKTAASATVITRQQIEESQFSDAISALKFVPGLNIADNGMPGQTAGVYTRGTDSRHTAILLDGHRLPTGAQRYFDLSFFPLVNVESIEVVRGPFSSTQGGSAVGGAINFISRRGAGEKPSGSVSAEYGSFDTQRLEAGLSVEKSGLYANVGGSYLSTENERPNSELESSSTLNTVGWKISEGATLELLAGYQQRDGGNPGSLTSPSLTENLNQDLVILSPRFSLATGEHWKQSLAYSFAEQNTEVTGSAFGDQDLVVKTQGLIYQVDYTPVETLAVQAGAEANWQTIDSDPTGTNTALPFYREERSTAVFAGATYSPVKNLTLVGSARRDVYDDYYGSANTWRYGASYRIEATGTVIHASDGTAFAAPEVQNFIDYGFGPSATTLAPERSRGQEIGVAQEFGKDFSVEATVFWNEIHDLVQYVFPSAQNVGLAKTHGVETVAAYRFAGTWTASAAYTYLTARDEVNDTPLARRPRHTVSAEVRGEVVRGWLVGAGVRGVMDRYDGFPLGPVEDYVVVRVFSQYALRENLLLKARVENVFDENYAEVAGYPALPVAVYGGIEWRF